MCTPDIVCVNITARAEPLPYNKRFHVGVGVLDDPLGYRKFCVMVKTIPYNQRFHVGAAFGRPIKWCERVWGDVGIAPYNKPFC